MSWAFYEYTGDDHNVVNVAESLNGEMQFIASHSDIGPRITATAKIVLSDMAGSVPRGGIFFYSQDPLDLPPRGSNWQSQTFWTMIHYREELYTPMVNFLNGLDLQMALSGHATMTNFPEGHATLTLWYPTED